MKIIIFIIIMFGLFGCDSNGQSDKTTDVQMIDLETLAFEGLNIDFKFNSNRPTFGDLFLIVGHQNPNFPSNSNEFEKLVDLGFSQVDDYFGIKNDIEIGDEVKLWLYPIIKDKEVHHNKGPFDAIRLNYVVIRNEVNTAQLLQKVIKEFKVNLDVTIFVFGKEIEDIEVIENKVNEIINYCRHDLNVEPGSDEALQLEY